MPRRCSDFPGGATHFGSGCAANRAACSASLRKAEVMSSATPSARAAAAMRSKASATSGRIGLPWRWANGPRYSPAVSGPASASVPGGTSSASAVAAFGTAALAPTAIASRTVTRDADRREPAAGEGDADVVRAVARGGRPGRVLAEREVLGALEVAWVVDAAEDRRLEDARVGVVHGAGGGQRGQVGGALQLPANADPASDPTEHDRAEHDRHEQSEQDHPRLAGLTRPADHDGRRSPPLPREGRRERTVAIEPPLRTDGTRTATPTPSPTWRTRRPDSRRGGRVAFAAPSGSAPTAAARAAARAAAPDSHSACPATTACQSRAPTSTTSGSSATVSTLACPSLASSRPSRQRRGEPCDSATAQPPRICAGTATPPPLLASWATTPARQREVRAAAAPRRAPARAGPGRA